MIKILIADDQELIRQSLMIILDNVPDFEVVDCVADGIEVMESVKEEKPDVILMDIRMPRMDGVVCTQRIKELYPDIKGIILSAFDDYEYVFNDLKFGASRDLREVISVKELSDSSTSLRIAASRSSVSRASGRSAFTECLTSVIPFLATLAIARSCSFVASGAISMSMIHASIPVMIPVRE